jgi:hypothetical protein
MTSNDRQPEVRSLSIEEQRIVGGGFTPSTGDPIPYPPLGLVPPILPRTRIATDAP